MRRCGWMVRLGSINGRYLRADGADGETTGMDRTSQLKGQREDPTEDAVLMTCLSRTALRHVILVPC
ncbi:hypothetical protein J6590_005742 [Homalodisca vitripennis]|nr:hypothetical protein J6590_005742 [Homalodisca vitripennis]